MLQDPELIALLGDGPGETRISYCSCDCAALTSLVQGVWYMYRTMRSLVIADLRPLIHPYYRIDIVTTHEELVGIELLVEAARTRLMIPLI